MLMHKWCEREDHSHRGGIRLRTLSNTTNYPSIKDLGEEKWQEGKS